MTDTRGAADEWDYIIVGSGAGGGPLAARLAEAGRRVLLLEAGSDPRAERGLRLPDDYCVPGFHAFACENPAMRWDFDVRHYSNEARQARDFKYDAARAGVLYPRAAALGGCSAHNAMIFMLPHDSDWDFIERLTGDSSWSARRMRRHARALEACRHRPWWRILAFFGIDPTGHGWRGWLPTERPLEFGALGDPQMALTLSVSALEFVRRLPRRWRALCRWFRQPGDPNARPWRSRSFEGLCYTPLTTHGHERAGARERVLEVAARLPRNLRVELDALATRVLFEGDTACGVEYQKGRHLYRAHAAPSQVPGELRRVYAGREIILCGGVFNTPQLLMLSGIGPADHLRAHGIPVKVDLPGVGRNLQDRYEVAVTFRARKPWRILEGAAFERGDELWRLWHATREGLYASNGAALGFVRRSADGLPEPDIFSMALPTRFEGYYRGFSKSLQQDHDILTWAVLKAHTRNRAGTVELRSADPRDPPQINFHYFEEGDDASGADLNALVEAIAFVRRLAEPLLAGGVLIEECSPGAQADTPAKMADYVRDTAWGHHASCSCRIGPAAGGGVLDAAFKVHGTQRLRVVDASVFPRIPGIFLVSAVYMIAEKAAETILGAGLPARTRS